LGSTKLPRKLRRAGYKILTHKEKYRGQQGIPDPKVIADCGKAGHILLTGDSGLETLWAVEIEKARLAVVILSNNSDGAIKWGARLATGRQDILQKLKLYRKPCAIRFGANAKVNFVRLYGPKRGKLIQI
jgi:hypothetical protein